MLNLICDGVSSIVSTGINGAVLIVPLIVLVYAIIGQAKEFANMAKKTFNE